VSFLRRGVSPVLCPGGVQEVTLMQHDKECVLYLKSRLGFVKLAMQQGVPIIPAFSFGLRKTFDCWLPRSKFVQDIGRKIGFLPLVFFGVGGLPYSPGKPVAYTTVVRHYSCCCR
jgi:2-acylglycerol O-acyltransferase 2